MVERQRVDRRAHSVVSAGQWLVCGGGWPDAGVVVAFAAARGPAEAADQTVGCFRRDLFGGVLRGAGAVDDSQLPRLSFLSATRASARRNAGRVCAARLSTLVAHMARR